MLFFNFRKDMPVLLLLKFCSEGDNTQDAIGIAQKLDGWMNLISKKVCDDYFFLFFLNL